MRCLVWMHPCRLWWVCAEVDEVVLFILLVPLGLPAASGISYTLPRFAMAYPAGSGSPVYGGAEVMVENVSFGRRQKSDSHTSVRNTSIFSMIRHLQAARRLSSDGSYILARRAAVTAASTRSDTAINCSSCHLRPTLQYMKTKSAGRHRCDDASRTAAPPLDIQR